MLYGDGAILIILVYFIIVVIVLTLLWRISIALDFIARHLFEIAKDVKKLSIHFRHQREDPPRGPAQEQDDEEAKE